MIDQPNSQRNENEPPPGLGNNPHDYSCGPTADVNGPHPSDPHSPDVAYLPQTSIQNAQPKRTTDSVPDGAQQPNNTRADTHRNEPEFVPIPSAKESMLDQGAYEHYFSFVKGQLALSLTDKDKNIDVTLKELVDKASCILGKATEPPSMEAFLKEKVERIVGQLDHKEIIRQQVSGWKIFQNNTAINKLDTIAYAIAMGLLYQKKYVDEPLMLEAKYAPTTEREEDAISNRKQTATKMQRLIDMYIGKNMQPSTANNSDCILFFRKIFAQDKPKAVYKSLHLLADLGIGQSDSESLVEIDIIERFASLAKLDEKIKNICDANDVSVNGAPITQEFCKSILTEDTTANLDIPTELFSILRDTCNEAESRVRISVIRNAFRNSFAPIKTLLLYLRYPNHIDEINEIWEDMLPKSNSMHSWDGISRELSRLAGNKEKNKGLLAEP